MKTLKISKRLLILILLLILEALFIKTFMYSVLPDKYFFDASRILGIMQNMGTADSSYMYVANIFKAINIFHLTSLREWGYAVSIVVFPFLIYGLTREKNYDVKQYIYIVASFTLLDIYVLGLSKESIQLIYVLLLYWILSSIKLSNIKKVLFMSVVLIYEALNFRVYYGIMAILIITIYVLFTKFVYGREMTKRKIAKMVFIILAVFFLEVFVVSLISYNSYDAILNARYSVNIWRSNDPNTNTIILDPFGQNTNYLKFILNYIINAVRLMIPIELFSKGSMQILFGIYQIYISITIFKAMKYMNRSNCLWFIVYISYLMVSIIFEPDFGSWVRHESVFFLIILKITCIGNPVGKEIKTDENITCGNVS